MKLAVARAFDDVRLISNPEELPSLLATHKPDVILLDMNFKSSINTGNEGLFWLSEIRRMSPSTNVVLFTAYADVNLAVEGMKRGAVDFIVKPFGNADLLKVLDNACHKADANVAKSGDNGSVPGMLWGVSASMQRLRNIVEKIARTDANVLITGENGTGKELLARELHRLSARSAKPMVGVDMGAIAESLFESELFGHAKGSFTDARADRAGKFEEADNSTLFLDEIGNLPLHLQPKLLTALQQRCVVRVGTNRPVPINIRLVCATNCDLEKMVADGRFRQDLLYRINTIHLEIPSLRQRSEDIPILAKFFVDKFAAVYGRGHIELLPDACMKLSAQSWPGNIRELEHAVEKAVIMAEGDTLAASDFDLPQAETRQADSIVSDNVTLEDMERAMITKAVNACEGNLSEAAKQLGITRQTLYNKLKRYGI